MRGRRLVFVAVAVVAVLTPGAAQAAVDVTVDEASLRFSPDRVTRSAGAAVNWHKSDGYHNVSSTDGLFRSGDPATSAFTYTRTFSAGTFDYLCEVHPTQMRGAIRIRPRARAAPQGAAFTVKWASPSTNTGTALKVQYRVSGGAWRTWKAETTANRGVFGRDAKPVRVRVGTLYEFRAKSLRGNAASAYSPIRRFRP